MLGGGDCESCIDNQDIDYAMISSSISFFVLLLELGIVSAQAAVSVVEIEAVAYRLGMCQCDIDIVIFDMCRMFRSAVAEKGRIQREKANKKKR
jgi:hypothetical protein